MRTETDFLHVDLDAFYAAVEELDDSALRGRAVVVGGTGNRGVVSTASYEARRFGVHSAMPTARARRACPHAVFLPPRFDRYSEKSDEVMAILRSVTPLVEQLSIDEAFVDAGGVGRTFGSGTAVAELLRERILDETGLTASIGVASTKFLAKLASDMAKPDGLLVVPAGTELAFLDPLPVTRLWGVGPATFRTLDRMAIRTIGDVARLPESVLVGALGNSLGRHLLALARNEDDREVVTDRETKSIGAEETFAADLHTRSDCEREILRLTDRAMARVRAAKFAARTVTLKVRFGDFETKTRSRTLPEATELTAAVAAIARTLFAEFEVARGIRLLGVSLSHFEPAGAVQQALPFPEPVGDEPSAPSSHAPAERRTALERASDAVRARFGDGAVRPAVLIDTRDRRPEDR